MACHCLQVTEEALLDAIAVFGIDSLADARRHTGAGDGCTACHRKIRRYIEQSRRVELAQASPSSSPSPI